MPVRLARAISLLGYCSRREAERLIAAGAVTVDGQLISNPATLVDPKRAHIVMAGKPLVGAARRTYLALHKPRGVVSTVRDPHATRTVVQLVPDAARLFPVGRLDKDSEGLLILTDDGSFANAVTHPRYEVEKEYLALVDRAPSPEALHHLSEGLPLDARLAKGRARLVRREAQGAWVSVTLHEGRKRQVRRMLEAVGHPVRRLIRTRIGPSLRLRRSWRSLGTTRCAPDRRVRNCTSCRRQAGWAPRRATTGR